MAKSIRPAPRSLSKSLTPEPKSVPVSESYWEGLNQTLAGHDEYERILPKTVHGTRRSSVHRKI